MAEILLLSSSTAPGYGFLDHAAGVVGEVLGGRRHVVYVSFGSGDPDRYTQLTADRLARLGVRVEGAHAAADPRAAVLEAEAVYVGGGNSFRLLDRLAALDLLGALRARIAGGVPYLGSSAGADLACPTIRTTTDMPIVEPGSLDALGLIPFQVNVHYPDPDTAGPGTAATRARQIQGFLEENDVPVLGLPEGTWLRVSGQTAVLGGVRACRLFRRGIEPGPLPSGSDVSWLLGLPATYMPRRV
jgi:dipeptidase E